MTFRSLWFAHGPSDAAALRLGLTPTGTGSWTYELARLLEADGGVDLVIACHTGVAKRVEHHSGPRSELYVPDHGSTRKLPDARLVAECRALVEEIRPDVVHIHGVEKSYGLALSRLGVPFVATVHGLVHLLHRGWWGGMSVRDVARVQSLRDLAAGKGVVADYARLRRRGAMERDVLRRASLVIGVSDWDEAHVRALDPAARYVRIPPAIRPEFFARKWRPAADVPYLLAVTTLYPAKGSLVLVQAFRQLVDEFAGLRLVVAGHPPTPGDPYQALLLDRVARLGLTSAVEFAGFRDASDLADLCAGAAVVVVPSFVENCSTALVEAMIVGAPAVVTFTGGTGSTAQDRWSATFVPPGDAELLAHQVARLLRDPAEARRLGSNARNAARARHDPAAIVAATLAAYESAA